MKINLNKDSIYANMDKKEEILSDQAINQILKLANNKKTDFSYNDIKECWKRFIFDLKKDGKLGSIHLYINIPFCKSKCYNCPFYITTPNSRSDIDSYIDYLAKTISFFKDIFKNTRLLNIYIGGGTPSILNEEQLENLLKLIFSNFNFFDYGERTFECNPESMNEEKIRILRKYGMNRITFGVQTLNPDLLKLHKRELQNAKHVFKLIEWIKKYNLHNNADIIFGLQNQSIKDILETLEGLMDKDVEQITLHRMMFDNFNDPKDRRNQMIMELRKELIPYLKRISDKKGYMMDNARFTFESFIFRKKEKTIKHEFSINDIPEEHKNSLRYTDLNDYPNCCFGLGPNAINYASGHFHYRMKKPDNWYKDNEYISFRPDMTIGTGELLSLDYEILGYISRQLRNDTPILDIDLINKIYNIDFKERYSDILDQFKKDYNIRIEGSKIILDHNEKEKILRFIRAFAKSIGKKNELIKYSSHKRIFNIKTDRYMKKFEDYMINEDFDELECSCKINQNQNHPKRFNLWFMNNKDDSLLMLVNKERTNKTIGDNNKAVYDRMNDFIDSFKDAMIKIDHSILDNIIDKKFEFDKVVTLVSGIDFRETINENRLKLWLIIKDYPAKVEQILKLQKYNDKMDIDLDGFFLFGIDFRFDGKTKLKIYPKFSKEELKSITLSKEETPLFTLEELDFIDDCNQITISNDNVTKQKIYHFHISKSTSDERKSFIEKIHNNTAKECIDKIDKSGYGIDVISLASDDIKNNRLNSINIYY